MNSSHEAHRSEILDQFTRQANTFSSVQARTSEDALRLLADAVEIEAADQVLDVACGPGIVSCWLARTAKSVTGVDLVPAMIERAQMRQAEEKLVNMHWSVSDAYDLPFPDEEFSLVITRYSFHHLLEPMRALREMTRVCRKHGRICVADVTPEEGKTEAYDRLEKLRDSSHAQTLSPTKLFELGSNTGLLLKASYAYRLTISLEAQLASSFPAPGHADEIRKSLRRDIGIDRLSVSAFEREDDVILRIPTSIAVWRKQ